MGTFTKNTIITFITNVLNLLLFLGASVIIARVLGPEGKGIYTLSILLATLSVTFTNIGIGPASVYYISKKKYSPKEIFGNDVFFSLIISGFAILIGLVIVLFFSGSLFPDIKKVYLLLALSLIPFQIFLNFVNCVLLGLQKIKEYNFINIITAFIFLVLVGIFLLGLALGIKSAIIALVISSLISASVLFFWTKSITGGFSLHLNKPYFRDSFLYGIKAYTSNILAFLHARIDILMINFFLNPIAVGFYSISVGITEKLWLISQSAAIVLFPKVASEEDEKRKKEFTPLVCRNVVLITAIGAFLLFLLSRWVIVLLFSEKFLDSVQPLQILLIGIVAISGSRILANDLAGRGKPMVNTYINTISVVSNILLNIFWIPRWGIEGAAWATTISYTITLLIRIIIYSRISGNSVKEILIPKRSDFKLYNRLFRLKL